MAFKTVRIWLDDSFYCRRGVTETRTWAKKRLKRFPPMLIFSHICSLPLLSNAVGFFGTEKPRKECYFGGVANSGRGNDCCFIKWCLKLLLLREASNIKHAPVRFTHVAEGSLEALSWNTCSYIPCATEIAFKEPDNSTLIWRLQQLHHTYILQVGRKRPLSGAEEMLRVGVPSWWQLGSSICPWKRSRFIFIRRTQVFMALTEEHSQLCDCWDCPEKPESESVHMLHFYWSS